MAAVGAVAGRLIFTWPHDRLADATSGQAIDFDIFSICAGNDTHEVTRVAFDCGSSKESAHGFNAERRHGFEEYRTPFGLLEQIDVEKDFLTGLFGCQFGRKVYPDVLRFELEPHNARSRNFQGLAKLQ